jgi:hypothetical protein
MAGILSVLAISEYGKSQQVGLIMTYVFTDEDDLTVDPLTSTEKVWERKLHKVLQECPDRLDLMITGGSLIEVIDKDGAEGSRLCDGAAERDGIVLATVGGKPTFHGVSG